MSENHIVRYAVVTDKPTLNVAMFNEGELSQAIEFAKKVRGIVIRAKPEGVDLEIMFLCACDPNEHKLMGVPMKEEKKPN